MALIEAFVRNPIKVSVAVLLVALFGTIALLRMPMQLTPEVQIPTLTIETVWPGASPQEVEREIVVEQEEQLKSVEGVTEMTSESMDSIGKITLEFPVGADIGAAWLKVNSRLQQVPRYPEDADQPVITSSSSSNNPIAWFILSARRPSPKQLVSFGQKHPNLLAELKSVQNAHNVGVAMLRLRQLATKHAEFLELLPPADLDVAKLKRFAEDEIEAKFERVSGVAQSNVIGGLRDEMQVVVDPERLALRQLTLSQVNTTLRGQNSDVSAGDFWEGKRRWIVRSLGRFRSPEQVENQLLAVRDGAPVFVRDVASVRHGHKKPDGMVRRFGESTIAINCMRENDANVLDVMAG
ncbi:MAG: efflux RND transporter permease subunit, partial [Planctomycetota bacterium]|nr:efflux RND transporter permease subunit [Planctomycetota bacterium]